MHPGGVATSLTRDWNLGPLGNAALALFRPLTRTPEQGADTVVWLASSAEVEGVTEGYFINRKPARLSRAAYDRLAARRMWEETERMLANGHS
jgi:hypothetical protein